MGGENERELTDAEMVALAALAQVQALSMKSENDARIANGLSPAYGWLNSDASDRLERELHRRGVL
jgi:hypothetical protein